MSQYISANLCNKVIKGTIIIAGIWGWGMRGEGHRMGVDRWTIMTNYGIYEQYISDKYMMYNTLMAILFNSLWPSGAIECWISRVIIGLRNGLSLIWCQGIIWTNAANGLLGTNVTEIKISIQLNAFFIWIMGYWISIYFNVQKMKYLSNYRQIKYLYTFSHGKW